MLAFIRMISLIKIHTKTTEAWVYISKSNSGILQGVFVIAVFNFLTFPLWKETAQFKGNQTAVFLLLYQSLREGDGETAYS